MAESISVYLPAKMLQKAVGLGRLLLFMYFMTRGEYGLWGLGMAIFTVAGPMLTLGSHHGLMRYAGHFEARGQLRAFYRRVRWCVLGVTLVAAGAAFAFSDVITEVVIVSRLPSAGVTGANQRLVCWAALSNALVLALYYNMLGLMYGMRTYRAAAAVELLFTGVFTGLGVAALSFWPTGLSALLAHLAALAVSLAAGMVLLGACVARLGPAACAGGGAPLGEQVAAEAMAGTHEAGSAVGIAATALHGGAPEALKGAFRRLLRFSLVALLGTTLWSWVGYVSFWLTSKFRGTSAGGVFHAFLSLGQPVLFVADAVWAVVFTHVARQWEGNRRGEAMATLETAYRAGAMAMMALTILVYAAAPLWVRVLPEKFRAGQELLGGLLMFFQVIAHLALLTTVAKLHERPIVIALSAAAGVTCNVLLALYWLPSRGPSGAALAAGVGVYVGSGVVTLAYLPAARVRLAWSTYLVLAAPALLLLGPWAAGAIWGGVCILAIATRLIFTAAEKRMLVAFGAQAIRRRNRES